MSAEVVSQDPVARGERLLQLDVLRGLALFGVLLVNIGYFCGADLAQEAGIAYPLGDFGGLAGDLVRVLLENKAAALLSILFGAGLAIQADRASDRGQSRWPFALRRSAVLALLGSVHTFLLWNVDILLDYALISLMVLPFLRLSAGRVLWAIPVVLIVSAVIAGPMQALATDLPPAQAYTLGLQHYGQGGWLDALQYRWWETLHVIGPMRIANRFVILAPFFIVGVAAWKGGWLSAPDAHRRRLRQVFVLCFSFGLVANAVPQEALHAWVNQLALQPLRVLIKVTFFFAKFALTLGYAAGILLLLQRSRWRVWLGVFAPLGRMALTQYLLQSLVCTWIFYGFGLGQYGRMPLDLALALGVLLFAMQVISSRWWLARFSIGPVEWLWRRLSYGGIRQRPPALAAAGAEAEQARSR
ncbi:hypothetical protein Y887_07950 [Xanthomonas pisi DSM 18956]|uniref:DUF418 domain-containing protein n=1 Tax=Xanthomonas pisi TaxID=56457 RepID=A0A2S7D0N5_9XANT|nr:DUF418 domain-containing protein [Xanthomonas pisi]KLD71183.1 hypothetical protein Y887_07950 [Xanthomonas pisi DSM 18956]PPU67289.1 DUF418 domain-containing protein [Xanthomonas pisi]